MRSSGPSADCSSVEAPSITESPTARIGPLRGIGGRAPDGGGAPCGVPVGGGCGGRWRWTGVEMKPGGSTRWLAARFELARAWRVMPGGSAATPSGVSATSPSSAATAPAVSASGVRGCAAKRGSRSVRRRSAPVRIGCSMKW